MADQLEDDELFVADADAGLDENQPLTEGDDDGDEVVISFDGDDEPGDGLSDSAPEWVKEVRRKNRELERRNRELEAKVQPVIEVGTKPTLAGCEYDEERFEAELDAFKERERKAAETLTKAQQEQQAAQREWQADLDRLADQEKALKVPGYQTARDDFTSSTSEVQQAVIVKAAKNPAQLIYALGKNPQRLATLSAIKDPIKLAVAVSELERGLKMTTRRRAPEPETQIRGSAPLSRGSNAAEKEYEKLSQRDNIDRGELRKFREKNGLDVHGKLIRERK